MYNIYIYPNQAAGWSYSRYIDGVLKWRIPNSWMVYNGKSWVLPAHGAVPPRRQSRRGKWHLGRRAMAPGAKKCAQNYCIYRQKL